MNRHTFFDKIRPAFGGVLTGDQVEGMEAILDAAEDESMDDLHHIANVLSNVRRETGGSMHPIKETVMPYHQNRNPTDEQVIARLDRAFARGQLPWVKQPYWRDGAFGRGQIQVTHDYNYKKFDITNYADALKLDVSARIAVKGMRDGMFTGRKLSDYHFPQALDARPPDNPRRIVNGPDKSDAEVGRFHKQFYAALVAADAEVGIVAAPVREKITESTTIRAVARDWMGTFGITAGGVLAWWGEQSEATQNTLYIAVAIVVAGLLLSGEAKVHVWRERLRRWAAGDR